MITTLSKEALRQEDGAGLLQPRPNGFGDITRVWWIAAGVVVPILPSSEEEGQLVEVHVGRNVADLAAVDGDLVCQHARGRNLDRVSPVVVVVAEGIGEVQHGVLGDLGGV